MTTTRWRHIDVEARGGVRLVRLKETRIEESVIDELTNELVAAGADAECRSVVLSLGPTPPECMYSIFLGKLITARRRLQEKGRAFYLCDVGPEVMAIFTARKLAEHFTFVDNVDAAPVV